MSDLKAKAKLWIDANVHDGEDRSGCKSDWSKFNPDDLQELIDDLVDDLFEEQQKQIDKLNKVVEAAKDFEKTLCIDIHIPPVPVTGKLAALVKALAELKR